MQTTIFKELGYAVTRGLLPVSRLGPVHIRRGRIERSVSEDVCARRRRGYCIHGIGGSYGLTEKVSGFLGQQTARA